MLKKILILSLSIFLIGCTTSRSYLESRYINIAEEVLPSVVEIISVGIEEDSKNKWFDFFQDQEDFQRDDINTGVGSGVILYKESDSYFILTNKHVVGNLDEVSVLLYNNELLKGSVIGFDVRFDIAVVKIETDLELSVAEISLSSRLRVGQFVAALGSPMSYAQSISMGIISNIGRFGGPKDNLSNYIQTDAAINHGNSGGPLVNMKGEVVGINTWISSPTSGNIGLGFSMPIENVYPSFLSIIENGFVPVGWIGISSYGFPDSDFYNVNSGAFINQVVVGSPAYKTGLLPGDIILGINETKISSSEELFLKISLLKPKDIANLKINRYSDELNISLELGESDKNVLETSKNVFPGFILSENENGLKIIEILPKSIGLSSGFKKGDIISSINGNRVIELQEFYKFINLGNNQLIITREDKELQLELKY
ncbi:PDZ domain-containing protein [Thiospirochaeta perfilievii]|uniref:PDZ domain-containing protein n=1 Tax=Thiospirochaeta perfilievii TaxID=252967 RepID=A0A5C1QHY4_9SPIO|nr:trypsin-like peptidase domain-containing protein [Thiospirochaeta perfilievii]QEN05862.1 PDZ domain-containing protein [Thiospirochaeta perfilievii]